MPERTQEEKELAYHWLRLPRDERQQLALELKLVTEDEVTSLKWRDLQMLILARAKEANVTGELWKLVQTYRVKWGEIP